MLPSELPRQSLNDAAKLSDDIRRAAADGDPKVNHYIGLFSDLVRDIAPSGSPEYKLAERLAGERSATWQEDVGAFIDAHRADLQTDLGAILVDATLMRRYPGIVFKQGEAELSLQQVRAMHPTLAQDRHVRGCRVSASAAQLAKMQMPPVVGEPLPTAVALEVRIDNPDGEDEIIDDMFMTISLLQPERILFTVPQGTGYQLYDLSQPPEDISHIPVVIRIQGPETTGEEFYDGALLRHPNVSIEGEINVQNTYVHTAYVHMLSKYAKRFPNLRIRIRDIQIAVRNTSGLDTTYPDALSISVDAMDTGDHLQAATALLRNASPKVLRIKCTGDRGKAWENAKAMLTALSDLDLHRLSLSNLRIDAEEIVSVLDNCTDTMTMLDLLYNNLTDDDLAALASHPVFQRLRYIDLDENPDITDEGLRRMAEAMPVPDSDRDTILEALLESRLYITQGVEQAEELEPK
jgi:hypothetical protein